MKLYCAARDRSAELRLAFLVLVSCRDSSLAPRSWPLFRNASWHPPDAIFLCECSPVHFRCRTSNTFSSGRDSLITTLQSLGYAPPFTRRFTPRELGKACRHQRGRPGGFHVLSKGGRTVPTHSPNPIRRDPVLSHHARNMTVSPSSRKDRVSPVFRATRSLPPFVDSMREPASGGRGPESVPDPRRSPGARLQPPTV